MEGPTSNYEMLLRINNRQRDVDSVELNSNNLSPGLNSEEVFPLSTER